MRYKTLILITLYVLSFNVFSQENEDANSFSLDQNIGISDSIVLKLADSDATIDSLINENRVIKGLLKETQNEIEQKDRDIANLQRKITDLQNISIKQLEASNDTLQRRLISMASNFLYIPYDEYSIYEIAIPAFVSTKGTPAYSKYSNRLPLLQNYKDDVSSLIDFLSRTEKDLAIGLTKMVENKAIEHLSNLTSMPLYLRYSSYDDWKNTYLGIQICLIQEHLKTPTKTTSAQLKSIRTKLEGLLNTN